MSFEFYSEVLLPSLSAAGVEEVGMFFLGESTIMPDLPKYIAEATNQGFPYIFLTTNGTALTKVKLHAYMQAGLKSLKFSMNYADAEQFADIARVKPALFGNLIQAIKDAHAAREAGGYDCGLYASYIDYDDEQGEKMMALIDEVRPYLDEVYALPLYSQADLTGQESTEAGWDVRAGNPGRAGNMRQPIPCWSLFTEARVTFDGELAGCCFAHDDRFNMGDLNKVDFMEAWHSNKFQDLRSHHLRGDVKGTACENCAAYS
jgi:radical SAM protein with 4Fe4S-binding SPASM domain